MIRNILIGLLLAVAAFVGLLVFNAMNYGAEPVGGRVTLPSPPEISAERGAQNLSRAIQFKTITLANGDPRPGQEGEWLALHAWLEETYPAAHVAMTKELVPDTLTLLYTWAGSDPSLKPLLLMAHQDVVPVNIGTEGDWQGAPFEGAIIDGYIYGRGAIDNKGSLLSSGFESADPIAGVAAKADQRRQKIEANMSHMIEELLEKTIGFGRVRA